MPTKEINAGFRLAAQGARAALGSPLLRRQTLYLLLAVVCVLPAAYVAAWALAAPLWLLLQLIDALEGYTGWDADPLSAAVLEAAGKTGIIVPYLCVYAWTAIESVFFPHRVDALMFDVFAGAAKDLDGDLRSLDVEPLSVWLWGLTTRLLRRSAQALGVLIASGLPYVGPFVVPAVQFMLCARALGVPLAGAFSALSFVPGMRGSALWALSCWMGAYAVGKELAEPWYTRRQLPPSAKKKMVAESKQVVLGFSLPFALLLSTPYIGVLFYAFAQAASGLLVAELERRHQATML